MVLPTTQCPQISYDEDPVLHVISYPVSLEGQTIKKLNLIGAKVFPPHCPWGPSEKPKGLWTSTVSVSHNMLTFTHFSHTHTPSHTLSTRSSGWPIQFLAHRSHTFQVRVSEITLESHEYTWAKMSRSESLLWKLHKLFLLPAPVFPVLSCQSRRVYSLTQF